MIAVPAICDVRRFHGSLIELLLELLIDVVKRSPLSKECRCRRHKAAHGDLLQLTAYHACITLIREAVTVEISLLQTAASYNAGRCWHRPSFQTEPAAQFTAVQLFVTLCRAWCIGRSLCEIPHGPLARWRVQMLMACVAAPRERTLTNAFVLDSYSASYSTYLISGNYGRKTAVEKLYSLCPVQKQIWTSRFSIVDAQAQDPV